jgi:sulfoacetaldehyde dehydrogenase
MQNNNQNIDDKTYIASLIERAIKAQKEIEHLSQRRVDEIAATIIYTFSRDDMAQKIAEMAYEETGMGKIESKVGKLRDKLPAILYDVLPQKTVGIIEEIPEKGLIKIGKPLGIIAAIIPATNPEATPVFKGMLGLRGRNAVISSPSRRSFNTTNYVINVMRQILKENGLPEDLFICVEEPSTSRSVELMRQCDVTMATGSGSMVKSAYSSGKPALGVGAGNAVVIIDETADIDDVVKKIIIGKTGDNASGCSAENSIIVNESIYDELIEKFQENSCYLMNEAEKQKLKETLWIDGKLNRKLVARPAHVIGTEVGIDMPKDTNMILVEETGAGKGFPFSQEKMSLVLTVYKYSDFDEAIETLNTIQRNSGFGHSCGIHSKNDENIFKLALNSYTVKVLVRQPHGAGNSGNWFNGLANTFSLGCGSWGGNSVSENITQKHFINTTWVSYPIDRDKASDEEIYKDLLNDVKIIKL